MTTQQNNEWGDIPQGWEVVALGDLAFIKTGSKNNQDKQDNGQYPFFVRSATVERINSYSYDCEAILIPGEGGIGSIFHYINGKFDAHQRVYVIRDFNGVVGRFVFYALKQFFGKYAMENSVKATVDSLRLPTFQNFQFVVPKSLTEQTAIATVLSDTDKWIDSLTALIAKKQAIKSATMSQLLSGQKRLPQFANYSDGTPKTYIQTDNGKIPEDWEVVALGEVCEFQNGFTFKSNLFKEIGLPIIRITNIDGKYVNLDDVKYFNISDYNSQMYLYEVNKGDILIAMSGATTGKIGYYDFSNVSYLNQRVGKFMPNKEILDNRYLYHFLLSKTDEISIMSYGGAQPNLSSNKLMRDIKIPLPPKTEQSAIAQILSDMDSDIIALEQRLVKAKALKQGLMHQLLTGKIRLFSGSLNN